MPELLDKDGLNSDYKFTCSGDNPPPLFFFWGGGGGGGGRGRGRGVEFFLIHSCVTVVKVTILRSALSDIPITTFVINDVYG